MYADIKYTFARTTALKTSYILQNRIGINPPFEFPATYKRAPHNKSGVFEALKGKQYLNFRETNNKLNPFQKLNYEYCLSLASSKFPIGLSFPNGTHRAAGNNRCMENRNDCFLVEFSQDWNELTLYIFLERGNETETLLNAWNDGQSIKVRGVE